MTLLVTAALYVGDKILAQIIKEEVWAKRLFFWFFPRITYTKLLEKLLNDTIIEFRNKFPGRSDGTKILFFEDKVTFDILSMYILFNQGNIELLVSDFEHRENVIKPTSEEISFFYDYFVQKINANKNLKYTFIEENYKGQIFKIQGAIDLIGSAVASIKGDTTEMKAQLSELVVELKYSKLTPQQIIDALKAQVNRQLKKQINSGKYLQDTFIEIGSHKENLRYLCDSIFYSEKCFEEIIILDFRFLNLFLKKRNHPEFILDFEKFKMDWDKMEIGNSNQIINEWFWHIESKKQEILDIKIASNLISKFEYKFRDRIDDLSFLKSRVAVITETAGQGKTDFLCDFTENFLLRRDIPTVFLTGVEIDPKDIRLSILRRVFPDSTEYTFEDLLNNLKNICEEQKKYFILIIDGINETPNSRLLSQTLESTISELLEYKFIKIVLSCRTEYFQLNFQNIEHSSFANEIQKISSLMGHRRDDDIKEKLFDIYFHHFSIEYRFISDKAYHQLVNNFLLLRIFCEVFQNQNLDSIEDIYKEDLFEKYYKLKCEEINKRLKNNDEYKIAGTFDIRNFISSIVEFMIRTNTYINVPLGKIIGEPKDREMYIRFLDENLLVKRDLATDEKGIFFDSEVVNFTFDEFRDFLLSRYLVEIVYKNSEKEFVNFIESQISTKSPLQEGCSTFLFFVSRRSPDEHLNDIISRQPWFDAVFSKCVFTLKDSQITDADKEAIKDNLIKDMGLGKNIIFNLIRRYDIENYKNLNLEFLFEMLREFDEQQYTKCFISKFGDDRWGHSTINQKSLINNISEILEKKELTEDSPKHKLFELLIYMFTNSDSWEIASTYEEYFFLFNEIGKKQLGKALNCKNEKLIYELTQFIEEYEISL